MKKGMALDKFPIFKMPKIIFSSPKGKPQLVSYGEADTQGKHTVLLVGRTRGKV